MKRLSYFCIAFVFFAAALFSKDSSVLETSIYNDLQSYYASGFYPGVVEKADLLKENYPQSSFLVRADYLKGKALIYLEEYEKACDTLKNLLRHSKNPFEIQVKANYELGIASHKIGDNYQAVTSFVTCANLSRNSEYKDYFYKSVFQAGQLYFIEEDYKNALLNFDYVVRNGKKYSRNDFNNAIQKLFLSCNAEKEYKKTISYYEELQESTFIKSQEEKRVFYILTIYAADACKEINQNDKAYRYYCKTVECGITDLAVIALKKAYVLAGEKQIGVNPSEVFSKTVETFSEEPELVREFWIRLGIDEYNKANYKKAADFFDNALQQASSDGKNEQAIITLYKAKILIEEGKSYAKAEEVLEKNIELLKDDSYKVSDSWYSSLLSCKVNLKKWDQVEGLYKKISLPMEIEKTNYAAYLYQNKKYDEVVSLLEGLVLKDKKSKYPHAQSLYASALLHLGQISKAAKTYELLYQNGKINDADKVEYSKALFTLKNYNKAKTLAEESKLPEAYYLAALSYINLQKWDKACDNFILYIKERNKIADFNLLAYFYKGYCEFTRDDYKNAYASFVRYTSEGSEEPYKYRKLAWDLAAKASLQSGNYEQAALQAQNLIKNSMSEEEKREAILFLSDIYTDSKAYDKAVKIMLPYTQVKNDFTLAAMFKLAGIYEKQKDLKSADSVYKNIYTNYPKEDYAQQAMYRSGEMYYAELDYASSQKAFNNYIYTYPDGLYTDAALFFCGDCDLNLKRFDECVMLNLTLIQKYPDCSYVYAAGKNLMEAYYNQEYFSKALDTARNLVDKYPQQASLDGIGKKLIQLEKIVSGTDKSVAEKYNEFEKLGKTETFEGRKAASQLVQLYAKNDSTLKEAVSLAEEILKNHKEDSIEEFEIAADNAYFLAEYNEKIMKEQKSAELYLEAARYYRACDNADKAAISLYSAASSFKNIGMTGDVKEVVDLLQKLYPESRQAKAAVRLLK